MHNVSVAYGDQSAQLKEIRAADPHGQGRHSFTAQQQTLRRLNVVFIAYLRRVRDAKGKQRRIGDPRFKPCQRFDQVLFVAGGGRWAHASFQAVGRIRISQHRPVVGRVKTLQLKREGRSWYVIVVTETEAVPLTPTGRSVGVDIVAKAESAGRRVVLVDPAHTSIDCHTCGARCIRPRQDTVVRPVHGGLDADLNGARNIAARAGLGSGQASAA
jgi:transposase